LNRSEEEGVGLEDLDVLQLELEKLLVAVTQRQMQLDNETEALMSWQDTKPKERKSVVKVEKDVTEKSGKRSRTSEERPSKKLKEGSSSSSTSSSTSSSSASASASASASGQSNSSSTGKSQLNKSKSKNLPAKHQDYEYTDSIASHPHQARNDIPDRFWMFIEPYTSPIKTEQLKVLEDLLKSYDDDADYLSLLKVPSLGKHYSMKWATIDDHWDGKKEGSKSSSEKKKGLSAVNSVMSPEKGRFGKKSKDSKGDPEKMPSYGIITQRLVSCLMEDPSFNGSGDTFDFEHDSIGRNGNAFKALSLGNSAQLEKKIRKELEDNGLLDLDFDVYPSSDTNLNEDDEVLKELQRCQNELKMVSSQNQLQLRSLLNAAKQDLVQQETQRKLQAADAEVVDAFRRMVQMKQKKRTPTKKEREMAAKALKDREAVLRSLETASPVP
jgi:transcriptional adapter 3